MYVTPSSGKHVRKGRKITEIKNFSILQQELNKSLGPIAQYAIATYFFRQLENEPESQDERKDRYIPGTYSRKIAVKFVTHFLVTNHSSHHYERYHGISHATFSHLLKFVIRKVCIWFKFC